MRAALIQIPTPPTTLSTSSTPEIPKAASLFAASDTSTPSSDHRAQDEETLILREISLLASARKSQFQVSSTLSETSRLTCRLELTDKIKMIFEEEKNILSLIDTASKNDQAPSRMKLAALRGFAQVMEQVTREELNSLRESYKHLSLFWITLARFEACHGHLADALKLLKNGLSEMKQDADHDMKEVDDLLEATRQIQNHYGDNESSTRNESMNEELTPRKRQRLSKNQSKQSESPAGDNESSNRNESMEEECTPRKRQRVNQTEKSESPAATTPRRSPRFVKSPKV
jgi:hypothetical protein